MKFKMRVLYHSAVGNGENVAMQVSRTQKTTMDKIPPAYPIENEKLVFLIVEMKGSADKTVVALCKDLTPARTKNVAIIGLGSKFEGIGELKTIIEGNGINVVDTYECEIGGLFKQGKIKDEDVTKIDKWADGIVEKLAQA
ncbi:MAG: flavodoxin family protein [Oscillospiraceae bacterium]